MKKQALSLCLVVLVAGCGQPGEVSSDAGAKPQSGKDSVIALIQAGITLDRQHLASSVAAAKTAGDALAAQDLNPASSPAAQQSARTHLQEGVKTLNDLLRAQQSLREALESITNFSARLQCLPPEIAGRMGGKTPVAQNPELVALMTEATKELRAAQAVARVLQSHGQKAEAMLIVIATTSETPSPRPGFSPAPRASNNNELIEASDYELRRVAQDYDVKIAIAHTPAERGRLIQTKSVALEAIRAKGERKINGARMYSAPGGYAPSDNSLQESLDLVQAQRENAMRDYRYRMSQPRW